MVPFPRQTHEQSKQKIKQCKSDLNRLPELPVSMQKTHFNILLIVCLSAWFAKLKTATKQISTNRDEVLDRAKLAAEANRYHVDTKYPFVFREKSNDRIEVWQIENNRYKEELK
jgi:hypothetical protein